MKRMRHFTYMPLQIAKGLAFGVLIILFVFILNQLKLVQLHYFPIKSVRVYGIAYTKQQEVIDNLLPLVKKGFFAVNIDLIQKKLSHFPWIANVVVKRTWPNKIDVFLMEQKPIAVWNEHYIMFEKGNFFLPESGRFPPLSLHLFGPMDKHDYVYNQYKDINRLLAPLHVKLSSLTLTNYYTWELSLDNGLHVRVSNEDVLYRLTRFVGVYSKIIGKNVDDVDYIDLRYPNGLVVRWKKSAKI